MAALQPLCHVLGINPYDFTKPEFYLIESKLYTIIWSELQIIFNKKYLDYLNVLKSDTKKEKMMLEIRFIQLILRDILETKAYNIQGIAYYTHTCEEVIEEILFEKSSSPSALFLLRLFELHQEARPELYAYLRKKITTTYFCDD